MLDGVRMMKTKSVRRVRVLIPFTLTLGSRHYGAGEVLEVTAEELKKQEHKVEFLELPTAAEAVEKKDEPEKAEELNEENRAVEEPVKAPAPRVRKATIPKKRGK